MTLISKKINKDDVVFLKIPENNLEEKSYGKESRHYVKNKDLYEIFVKHTANKKHCLENGLPKPQLPDGIARSIVLIANRMASKYKFNNYYYKEEMIGDGILECFTYVNNFDPSLPSKNPFAYISQLIKNGFYKRSTKESKQQYTRLKIYSDFKITDSQHDTTNEGDEFFIDHQNKLGKLEEFINSKKKKTIPKLKNKDDNTLITKFQTENKS